MIEIEIGSKIRADARKHGDDAGGQTDAQGPRPAFLREGMTATGKHDAGSNSPDQQRESSDEHHVQEVR